MHMPLQKKSQILRGRKVHKYAYIHWHTEPSFLLLKTKLWTNADQSVTVATATLHALFELKKIENPWNFFLIIFTESISWALMNHE